MLQNCYICGAKPTQLRDPNLRLEIRKDRLNFGLSILHAMIKFLELILKLAYKLMFHRARAIQEEEAGMEESAKKKRKPTPEEEAEIAERTRKIKSMLTKEVGIKVRRKMIKIHLQMKLVNSIFKHVFSLNSRWIKFYQEAVPLILGTVLGDFSKIRRKLATLQE